MNHKNIYLKKYGNPVDTSVRRSHLIYLIKNNRILQASDLDRTGIYYTWKTEYLTITFFTGLRSYTSLFNQKGYLDATWSSDVLNSFVPVDSSKAETQCNSYSYIQYELSDKAIKQLKLDDKSL